MPNTYPLWNQPREGPGPPTQRLLCKGECSSSSREHGSEPGTRLGKQLQAGCQHQLTSSPGALEQYAASTTIQGTWEALPSLPRAWSKQASASQLHAMETSESTPRHSPPLTDLSPVACTLHMSLKFPSQAKLCFKTLGNRRLTYKRSGLPR